MLKLKPQILITLCCVLFIQVSFAQVSVRDTSWTWRHFDYSLNPDLTIATVSSTEIVETEFHGKVIENEYIKIVTLAEFGGRILSYIYKPTGHEQLYQNPIGTPYLIGNAFFYFDWLMVYGGIFPTFPEPEHGKAWLLPWDEEIVENTSDKVVIDMSFTDTINNAAPAGFNNGLTEITCHFAVGVYKGRSDIEIEVTLINNKDQSVIYEYWTNGTLAPGSVPGDPKCTANAEIIAPINTVRLKDDWWPWMNTSEQVVDGGQHLFEWNNLAQYSNWDGWGIVYAYPNIVENYYGLINHDNEEGIFRVGDNVNSTVGLKMYTFGYELSRDADPTDFTQIERPFIELWSGVSSEFFFDATLSPREVKNWTANYLPSVGMPKVTAVNKNGALDIDYEDDHFLATFFSTTPNQTHQIELKLINNWQQVIASDEFEASATIPFTIDIDRAGLDLDPGDYAYEVCINDEQGNLLLSATKPVTITGNPNGITAQFEADKLSVAVNESITFTNTSLGNIQTVNWDFGSGASTQQASSNGPHTISYSTPGEKIIHISVSGPLGSDHYFSTINVGAAGCDADYHDNLQGSGSVNYLRNDPEIISHFTFSENETGLSVNSNGAYHQYDDYFAYDLNDGNQKITVDISNSSQKLYARLKSSVDMGLRLTLEDNTGRQALNPELAGDFATYEALSFDIPVTSEWQTFEIDFSNKFHDIWSNDGGGQVDISNIASVAFRPNPGYNDFFILGFNYPFNGRLDIDYIVIGDSVSCFQKFDCHGDLNGQAIVDACGKCAEGNTGRVAVQNPNQCEVVGFDEIARSNFKVFPNPTNGFTYFEMPGTENVTLKLVNDKGIELYTTTLASDGGNIKKHLDLSKFDTGIYSLIIQSDEEIISHKIVKF